jgi:hypothetical protein
MTLAINQIVTIANAEIAKAREALENPNTKGREVPMLQGNIVGYKTLINHMAGQLALTQFMLENTNDQPMEMEKLDDRYLEELSLDIAMMKGDPAWLGVIAQVDADIEEMKRFLLFEAEGAHDMDLKQGQYRGEVVYLRLFSDVSTEMDRRQRKRDKEAAEPQLPFDTAQEKKPEDLALGAYKIDQPEEDGSPDPEDNFEDDPLPGPEAMKQGAEA